MRLLILIVLSFAFIGCATIPVKSSTRLANYNKMIVKNINWKETAVSEITDKELKQFIDAQPRLNEIFRIEFAKRIKEVGYFDTLADDSAQPDSTTLILEPKIYTLKLGSYMPGATFTGFLKTSEGKMIGSFTAERREMSAHGLETIEILMKELAEDAAANMPFTKIVN